MTRSALQDEIKKRNPFDSAEQEVALNLARTADYIQGDFARLFKEHGISPPQYNVLRVLRGAATELPCLEIGSRMISHLPDITRLVDRLEAAGLVGRCRTQEDRRLVLVKVTEKGLKLLAELDGPVLELHRRQLGHLTPEELAEFNRLLVKARRPNG
jgi:DNA-binding MarR family transcriptional regulator